VGQIVPTPPTTNIGDHHHCETTSIHSTPYIFQKSSIVFSALEPLLSCNCEENRVIKETMASPPSDLPEMEYRFLGRSGLQVSAISLGGWLTYGGHVDDGTLQLHAYGYTESYLNF
jgi:hypothetical protein